MSISKEKVSAYLNSFKKKNVLIVGDVMLDSYMWGNATRISPEAPIPVVAVTNKDFRLGGAANVALNIMALNAKPYLCSVIGMDNYSTIFRKLLKDNNLSEEGIIQDRNRVTTVKTRVISNGQQLLRVDEEMENDLDAEIADELLNRIKKIINNHNIDVIIFEDYDKGVLNHSVIEKIINLSKETGIITTVDPKKKNFNSYANVNLFKPNLKEFIEGLKIEITKNDVDLLPKYTHQYLKEKNIDKIMITLSELGAIISEESKDFHYPALEISIADVSGAGDTVISIASLLLTENATIEEVAEISNIAGGLVCSKVGVIPINSEELENYFN